MSKFTTRVELHDTNDGTSEEYKVLHEAMEEAGFSRTIKDEEGIEYYLPPAEYNYEGDKTIEEVVKLARGAASKTGKKYSVLTTQSKSRRWFELEEVK